MGGREDDGASRAWWWKGMDHRPSAPDKLRGETKAEGERERRAVQRRRRDWREAGESGKSIKGRDTYKSTNTHTQGMEEREVNTLVAVRGT